MVEKVTETMIDAGIRFIRDEYGWGDQLLGDVTPFELHCILAAALGLPQPALEEGAAPLAEQKTPV